MTLSQEARQSLIYSTVADASTLRRARKKIPRINRRWNAASVSLYDDAEYML
jgi:hypothetical protein